MKIKLCEIQLEGDEQIRVVKSDLSVVIIGGQQPPVRPPMPLPIHPEADDIKVSNLLPKS